MATLGVKMFNWLTRPMNPCKVVRFLGLGKLVTACRQDGSGTTLSAEMRNPTNLTCITTSSFRLEMVMPSQQQLDRTHRMHNWSSPIILPLTRKLSTNFRTPGMPSRSRRWQNRCLEILERRTALYYARF